MLKMLKTMLKNPRKIQIFQWMAKNSKRVFHNSAKLPVEKWKTLIYVRYAQLYHLSPKTAKKCMEINGESYEKNDFIFSEKGN